MNQFDITRALAAEQLHDRTRVAGQSWLAAVARCCRPTTWGRAARRITAAVLAVATGRRVTPEGCCA